MPQPLSRKWRVWLEPLVQSLGVGPAVPLTLGQEKSRRATSDITIASRGVRGQGGISKETGAALPSSLFPPSLP